MRFRNICRAFYPASQARLVPLCEIPLLVARRRTAVLSTLFFNGLNLHINCLRGCIVSSKSISGPVPPLRPAPRLAFLLFEDNWTLGNSLHILLILLQRSHPRHVLIGGARRRRDFSRSQIVGTSAEPVPSSAALSGTCLLRQQPPFPVFSFLCHRAIAVVYGVVQVRGPKRRRTGPYITRAAV